MSVRLGGVAGVTGLEPATSGVTGQVERLSGHRKLTLADRATHPETGREYQPAASDMDLPRPRLRWRRTWPDGAGDPNDFSAGDPAHPDMHARIYLSRSGAPVGGAWIWAVGEQANLGTGTAETPRAAALAAEVAWFAYRDGCQGAPATECEKDPDVSTKP